MLISKEFPETKLRSDFSKYKKKKSKTKTAKQTKNNMLLELSDILCEFAVLWSQYFQVCLFVLDRILYSTGWPWNHYVPEFNLEFQGSYCPHFPIAKIRSTHHHNFMRKFRLNLGIYACRARSLLSDPIISVFHYGHVMFRSIYSDSTAQISSFNLTKLGKRWRTWESNIRVNL